jgi:uncharacterized DUF497 family protein
MSDFDLAKEAINLAKHRISLARWVDLKISATVPDSRFDYGEPRYRAYGLLDGLPHCLVFTMRTGRSVYDVLMPRS